MNNEITYTYTLSAGKEILIETGSDNSVRQYIISGLTDILSSKTKRDAEFQAQAAKQQAAMDAEVAKAQLLVDEVAKLTA